MMQSEDENVTTNSGDSLCLEGESKSSDHIETQFHLFRGSTSSPIFRVGDTKQLNFLDAIIEGSVLSLHI